MGEGHGASSPSPLRVLSESHTTERRDVYVAGSSSAAEAAARLLPGCPKDASGTAWGTACGTASGTASTLIQPRSPQHGLIIVTVRMRVRPAGDLPNLSTWLTSRWAKTGHVNRFG